jgi:hypothetical protein
MSGHGRNDWLRPGLGVLAALLAAAAAAGVASAKPAPEPPPSRLLVTAREYGLTLSRPKLAPGQSIVQLYDYGEDPHNLVLQKVGGPTAYTTGTVEPGETGEVRLRLRQRSTYRLWCSLADHAQRGMTAELKVAKKKKRKRR